MLDKIEKEAFIQQLNQPFKIQVEENKTVDFVLLEVNALPTRPKGGRLFKTANINIREEPFSMVFRGPADMAFVQQMFHMENEAIGKISGLFMVPIGENEDGRYYEAIMN